MKKSKPGKRDDWKLDQETIEGFRKYRREVRAKYEHRIQDALIDESWVGAAVWFIPGHAEKWAREKPDESDYTEHGHITNWNSRGVFVCYDGDRHSKLTYTRDLILQTPASEEEDRNG